MKRVLSWSLIGIVAVAGTVAIEELDYGDAGKITRFKSHGEDRVNAISYTKARDGFAVFYHPNGQKKSSAMWIDDHVVVDMPDDISKFLK